MKVYVAEKPSLGREIANIIGVKEKKRTHIECTNGDIVTWCFGHMYAFINPQEYDEKYKSWNIDSLPIVPHIFKRKMIPKVKEQVKTIKGFLKEASIVVNAGDPDREGQLLVDELLEELKWKGQTDRIWLTALNEKALKNALSSMESNDKYKGLRDSAFGRSAADWLVGMNMTRAFTVKAQEAGKDGVFSVGRVQSPTLKLVVDRDRTIKNFVTIPYYVVNAGFDAESGGYIAKWIVPEDKADSEGRCLDKDKAGSIVEKITGKTGLVKSVETKEKKKSAELPFSLSALQTYCSKKWGLAAQEVLDIAQSLYEKHKATTYPRTDCRYLAEGAFVEVQETMAGIIVGDGSIKDVIKKCDLETPPRCFNDKKITAHTAIIPTTDSANIDAMSEQERNVFDAIKRRFVAQFLPPYTYSSTTIVTECESQLFKSQGTIILDLGWKIAQDDEKKDKDTILPSVNQNDSVVCGSAKSELKNTKPPQYYTEGTLIADMENIAKYVEDKNAKKLLKSEDVKGIGTEATRAAIIENLKGKEYVRTEKKFIKSTNKGKETIDVLPSSLTDPVTTAEWEDKLKNIANNGGSSEIFIADIAAFVEAEIEKLKKQAGSPFKVSDDIVKCPVCGKTMRRRKGQYGYFWGCSGFPECKQMGKDNNGKPDFTTKGKKPLELSEHLCGKCEKPLVKRLSKKKKSKDKDRYWWGCSGFPKCKQTYFDSNGKPNYEAGKNK